MINLERFETKLENFEDGRIRHRTMCYMEQFDCFWKRKLKIESKDHHILDDDYREETYRKLSCILDYWRAYRRAKNPEPYRSLQHSMAKISDAYAKIRTYSLLEFNEIPIEPLKLIWNELGYVKDKRKHPPRGYLIISIGKPLMLLWGQTLAFDSRVRKNSPQWVPREYRRRWKFEKWMEVMKSFQRELKHVVEAVDLFKGISRDKYGTDSTVPYGRFLDIYYY